MQFYYSSFALEGVRMLISSVECGTGKEEGKEEEREAETEE